MADAELAVVFRGRVIEGTDPVTVRANLAKLFNADAARIEKMFSGSAVVIKRGLDPEGAEKYRAALARAGAEVELVDLARAAPAAAATPTPTPTPSVAPAQVPAASDVPPQVIPAAFQQKDGPPAALEATMADAGETLVDYQTLPTPDIATDHLSVAEVGVTLVEHQPVAEPAFDLSGLTLDPPGTTIVEPRRVAAPEFDLSALSLADGS